MLALALKLTQLVSIIAFIQWGQPICDIRGKICCKTTDKVPGDPYTCLIGILLSFILMLKGKSGRQL